MYKVNSKTNQEAMICLEFINLYYKITGTFYVLNIGAGKSKDIKITYLTSLSFVCTGLCDARTKQQRCMPDWKYET